VIFLIAVDESSFFGIISGDLVVSFPFLSMSVDTLPAVGVRPKDRRKNKDKPKKEPRFHVILWNDEVHTFDYVIIMLHSRFDYPA